jgi:CheY-like chemotaxis protein
MKTKHILIVDDEPTLAFLLGMILERSGQMHRIYVTQSSTDASQMLDKLPVDLLITDLCMPHIDGLDLVRQARMSCPHMRVMLITAYGSDEVETQARDLEAHCYMTKPFHASDFLEAVQETLDAPQMPHHQHAIPSD